MPESWGEPIVQSWSSSAPMPIQQCRTTSRSTKTCSNSQDMPSVRSLSRPASEAWVEEGSPTEHGNMAEERTSEEPCESGEPLAEEAPASVTEHRSFTESRIPEKLHSEAVVADNGDSGGDWTLEQEESDDDEVLHVRSSWPECGGPDSARADEQSTAASESPLSIPAEASLQDGLRALLVHHLKRSVGSGNISLTTGQADLLEHHMARLASYAQKIVHTLAFATRFLMNDQMSLGESQEDAQSSPRYAVSNTDDEQCSMHMHQEERPPKHKSTLKLKDREIMELFRSAQQEASKEADWRGITGPEVTPGSPSEGGSTARSEGSMAARFATQKTAVKAPEDLDFLGQISRAMQQPGRTPETFTAEMLDSHRSSQSSPIFCQSPHALLAQRSARSRAPAMIRWPQVPPDPGARNSRKSVLHDRSIM
eukprot:TRINITY_DN78279_c0_g1_i1.p1 TRINITY_DN78279_c0_g1~~TRINITY_DN78279_c0_g1_i1.p1  ORF type:complete len:425 (+),score=62.89 TRINITY_DN78279_c0_g1_i1:272-1546(+)